jgi:hypothetical protein
MDLGSITLFALGWVAGVASVTVGLAIGAYLKAQHRYERKGPWRD